MSKQNSKPVADIILSVAVMVAAVAIYSESTELPPAYWEPLGSAALPQALCILMSGLAAIILVRAVLSLRQVKRSGTKDTPAPETQEFQRRPWAAVFMMVFFVAYIATMNFGLLGFVEATALFLISVCLLLTKAAKAHIPWIVIFALVLSVGNYLVFTRFLYIDLPTTSWL